MCLYKGMLLGGSATPKEDHLLQPPACNGHFHLCISAPNWTSWKHKGSCLRASRLDNQNRCYSHHFLWEFIPKLSHSHSSKEEKKLQKSLSHTSVINFCYAFYRVTFSIFQRFLRAFSSHHLICNSLRLSLEVLYLFYLRNCLCNCYTDSLLSL